MRTLEQALKDRQVERKQEEAEATNDKLYFVKFQDGATYSSGEQIDGNKTIPGGPIGFEVDAMAQETAQSISGYVVEKEYHLAVAFCFDKGYTLFIRRANGNTAYLPLTVPANPSEKIIRASDAERTALNEVWRRQLK